MASGAVAYNIGGQGAAPRMPPTPPSRGYTGASLSGSQRPTTAERLTPMPDYMHPVTRSSAKRFRKLHEDLMMDKLMQKRSAKKERNVKTRDEARTLARKIPMEVLAKDWFSEHEGTVETRAFLVDKIMPTLILGVEKLLLEVGNRNLAESDSPDDNFNPINFLAQYLMRNNPRYSNFSEASPYVRGLRKVTDELRKQLFDLEENRLARIKAEAKRKREEREHDEKMRQMEKKRRNELLTEQFSQWHSSTREVDPRLDLALLQNALRSFQEIAQQFPEPQKSNARFSKELDPTDDTGRDIGQREFILYVTSFVEEMASDMFDQFIRHMSQCAHSHVSQADRIKREAVLAQLFKQCDHTGVGLLDRPRILNLFKMFWNKAPEEAKEVLRNPRKWPMVDVDELDSYYDSDDEEAAELPTSNQSQPSDPADDQPVSEVAEVTSQPDAKQGSETSEEKKESEEGEVKPEGEGEAAEGEAKEGEQGAETTTEGEEKTAEGESKAEDAADTSAETGEQERTDEAPTTETAEQKAEESKPEDGDKPKDGEKAEAIEEGGSGGDGEATMKDSGAGAEPEVRPVGVEEGKEGEAASAVADGESVGEKVAGESNGGEGAQSTIQEEEILDPELAKLMSAKTSVISGRPPMTQQSKVSFAEGTTFEKERALLTSHGTRSKSQASTYDENTLNESQFTQLTETFMGDAPNMEYFQQLVRYLRDGYVETEDERMSRLLKARGEVQSAKRKALLNSIFEMWDNEGSGYLDLDEVVFTMKKYKEGVENAHIDKAKKDFKERSDFHDNRLSKREFRTFVYNVVAEMGGGEALEYFMEFLLNNVERSYQERVRGEARKKWLQQIIDSGETSAARMEPVYKAVFQALYKDADAHGQGKMISSYIALLERNDVAADRGDFLLRYTGATLDHADKLLNKALFRDMKGISFACIDSGKPIHVPRVASHGNIYFWDPNKPADDTDGSLIVVPLKDQRKRAFGILGIDTLSDHRENRTIFITHEIQFFQGVAKAFSIAYHHVDMRIKTMRISESAISWIHRRSPNVHEITIYMMEPDGKGQDYVLRRMMHTDDKGMAVVKKIPDTLERKDNLFRDYLFKCVDNSESVTADAYGERHLAIPLRDDEGRAIVVVDISIGSMKALPKLESREVMKMLKLLQLAYKEISRESREGEKNSVLEAEQSVDDETRTEILFDKLMLMELRDNVSRLDAQAYAELKSYKEPPAVVHQIIKAVLAIFYPDLAKAEEFENWDKCKKYVNPGLGGKIMAFDPTSSEADVVNVDAVNKQLAEVPHGTVSKHGSFPAQFLYNWVFVCVSLIEHTRKMNANRQSIVEEMNKDEKTN